MIKIDSVRPFPGAMMLKVEVDGSPIEILSELCGIVKTCIGELAKQAEAPEELLQMEFLLRISSDFRDANTIEKGAVKAEAEAEAICRRASENGQ